METAWIIYIIASFAVNAVLTGLTFVLLHRIYLKKWSGAAFLYGIISRLACSAIAYGISIRVISIPFIHEQLSVSASSIIGMLLNSLLLAASATFLFRNGIIKNCILLFSVNTMIFLVYNGIVGGAQSLIFVYLFYNSY